MGALSAPEARAAINSSSIVISVIGFFYVLFRNFRYVPGDVKVKAIRKLNVAGVELAPQLVKGQPDAGFHRPQRDTFPFGDF